jgi:hypothetical protein
MTRRSDGTSPSEVVGRVRAWLQDELAVANPTPLWRIILGEESMRPGGVAKLIERAESGNPDADMLLCTAGAHFLHTAGGIPEPIRTYVGTKLAHIGIGEVWPEPAKHNKARKTVARDIMIVLIMAKLVREGYRPTRNSGAKHASAASIIAEAGVNPPIGEDGIADVWARCGWIAELFEEKPSDPNALH